MSIPPQPGDKVFCGSQQWWCAQSTGSGLGVLSVKFSLLRRIEVEKWRAEKNYFKVLNPGTAVQQGRGVVCEGTAGLQKRRCSWAILGSWVDGQSSKNTGPEFRALKLIPLIVPLVFAIKNEIFSTLLVPFKVKLYIFLTKNINDEWIMYNPKHCWI